MEDLYVVQEARTEHYILQTEGVCNICYKCSCRSTPFSKCYGSSVGISLGSCVAIEDKKGKIGQSLSIRQTSVA